MNSFVTKKIDQAVTISAEQYSAKKLQLNLLGGKLFLTKFNKRGILIKKGVQQKSQKLKSGGNTTLWNS